MKVLHITPSYSPSVGGIEKVVEHLALSLTTHGVSSGVAHVAPGLRPQRDTTGTVEIFRVPLLGNRLLGWAPSLAAAISEYDLLHVHDPHLMALTANVAAQRSTQPMLLSTHGGYRHTKRLEIAKTVHERIAIRTMLGLYDTVLATSKADLEHFSRFRDGIVLAENGVDTARFSKIEDYGRSTDRWIYWGRFSPNKRLDATLELAHQAVTAGFRIDLLIAGPDRSQYGTALQEQILSAGLESFVRIANGLSDRELDRELRTRGIYITASEHEGFGLSIVEAMSAGLIIACRDLAPLNSFVTNGQTGFFFRFDRGHADQRQLERLLRSSSSDRKEMSARARFTAEKYAWESAASRFADAYQKAMSKRSRSRLSQ